MTGSYLLSVPFLFCSLSLFAHQASVPAPTGSPAVSTAGKRIILSVVVNDKSKTPVTGLQQADFTIFDNQQPQKILSFEAAGQSTSVDAATEIILVIDSVNTSFSRVALGRAEVAKLLRRDGGKLSQPVSISFFSDAGLDIQKMASRDGNALAAYLDQHGNPLRSLRRSQGFYGAADRADLSVHALGQLADYEAKRPGRKVVVWISPGWPLLSGPNVRLTDKAEQGIFNAIVATSTLLRQARITLNDVDPSGTSDAGGFRTFYYQEFLKPVKEPNKAQLGNLALQVLATQSGGRVLNSSNDIAGEVESCVRDAGAGYVLSYNSGPSDDAGEYHSIDVKIARPELKAQTRSGYYAQPARPHNP